MIVALWWLQAIFILLKLLAYVTWSWWLVFLPFFALLLWVTFWVLLAGWLLMAVDNPHRSFLR